MSKYTFELREVISTFGRDEVKRWFSDYELSDYLTAEEIAVIEEKGVWSKDQLAERILDHFYTREIGTDAIGQFMLFIKDRLREVMETYVPIIYSASIKYDPLVNVNFSEIYSGTSGSSSSASTQTNASGLSVASDTPQGQINKDEILQGKYASSTGANENASSGSSSTDATGREEYVKTTKGNSGVTATSQAMIKQYRDVIRAVNTEIVYELEPLFMGIY
ncbi:MAG: hypothetical protein J6S67_11630 [Methanobrevibacter sp.]|nr:hypothetical protein [Methanobrevibacter sp.]